MPSGQSKAARVLTELAKPDKAAAFIEARLANPENAVRFAALQAGLPAQTALELNNRLTQRYSELELLKPMVREVHEKRLSQRMEWLDCWLTKEKFEELLSEAKLKDIMVADAVLLDKWLILKGQPNQIIGTADQKKMDDLGPALLAEMKRRGLSAKLTERTAEITVEPQSE